jgi:hypothetical protein
LFLIICHALFFLTIWQHPFLLTICHTLFCLSIFSPPATPFFFFTILPHPFPAFLIKFTFNILKVLFCLSLIY